MSMQWGCVDMPRHNVASCDVRNIVARVDRLQRLAVFESAGRLGSFTAAADEMGMTQPAVTRHIRSLEASIGHTLFIRTSNRSRLSEAGAVLLAAVSEGFDAVERGLDKLDHEVETFELATGPSMAQYVLVPMLDKLQSAIGDIDVRMTIFDGRRTFDRSRYDAVTQLSPAPGPGLRSELLFPEVVVPVASPGLAEKLGLDYLSEPEDLVPAPRIHEVQGFREWMSWDGWFEANGVDRPDRQRRVLLNNHPLVIQQAIAGAGVALGWCYLVDQLVADGLLVHVGQPTPTGKGFYLTWPKTETDDRCSRVAKAITDYAKSVDLILAKSEVAIGAVADLART